MSIIGERIKELRKKHKLTQKEFSTKICIKQSYLSDIENGNGMPSDMLIKLISLEFNVPIDWLNGEKEETTFEVDFLGRGSTFHTREDDLFFRDFTLYTLQKSLELINSPHLDSSFSLMLDEFMHIFKLRKGEVSSTDILIINALITMMLEILNTVRLFREIKSTSLFDTKSKFINDKLISSNKIFFDTLYEIFNNVSDSSPIDNFDDIAAIEKYIDEFKRNIDQKKYNYN